jgi:PAS domain S-box-containing protein
MSSPEPAPAPFLHLVPRGHDQPANDSEVRHIVETSPDLICVTAVDGTFTYVNKAFKRLLGYDPADLLGVQALTLIHPDDAGRVALAVFRDPNVQRVAFRFKHKDGHWLDTEMSRSVTLDANGVPVSAVIVSRDISDRMRAEERFHTLADHSPIGIYISQERRLRYVNPRYCAYTGFSESELIGTDPMLLVYADDRIGVRENAIEMLKGQRQNEYEYRVVTKNGDVRWIMESLVSIDYNGRRAVLGNFVDITGRKQAEDLQQRTLDELVRSNEELGQFAYVASHDLQEPLRMVASFTQLLARRYRGKLDDDADEFIRYAVDGVTRMQNLINDLLSYSRVGTRGHDMEPTDCNAIVERCRTLLMAAIEESGATITAGPLPTVTADGSQFEQLFQNLIGNAVKYRGERAPEIAISAHREERRWHFVFKDNGIGIDPEYRDRIFVIFQRLHGKEEYEGTGIGLSICKKIVERHGGRIWVDSQPGAGASFHFTIPDSEGAQR